MKIWLKPVGTDPAASGALRLGEVGHVALERAAVKPHIIVTHNRDLF